MTKDALYTLDELAQVTGVTPRTIRYYTSEGLLPPPHARGRFALYGEAHRNRLRLIVLLKQALMPLAAMRVSLSHVTDAQIAALLAQNDAGGDSLKSFESGEAFPLEVSAVGTPLGEQADAYQALAVALSGRRGVGNSERSGSKKSSPDRRQRRALLVSARLKPDHSGEDDSGEMEASGGAEETGQDTGTIQASNLKVDKSESWQRILLAPGVELHVRTPDTPHAREHLDQVIAEAKSLFKP